VVKIIYNMWIVNNNIDKIKIVFLQTFDWGNNKTLTSV